jgi:hypothetical protein
MLPPMAPPRSLAFHVYDDLIVLALGQHDLRDDDWASFVDKAGSEIMRRPRPVLVVSEGGLPSASQREAMDQKLPAVGVLTAVMIDSLVARSAVTVRSWFSSMTIRAFPINSKFRAFPKHDHDDALLEALRYLEVDPARDAAIAGALPRLLNLVASGEAPPSNYSDDIFNALDDDGRLWGRFWITHHRERLAILAPVKGDGSHDDLALLLELTVVQTTSVLTVDLTFWQPNEGYRGSTKTGEERLTVSDPTQTRGLDLTVAGRAWGRLAVEVDRWSFLDPKGRARLELTPTTDATNGLTLRRRDVPVLRVVALGPDGQPLRSMTVVPP